MQIRNLTPGGFASDCWLLTNEGDAVLIDCSAPAADVEAALSETGTHLAAILLTHGHFDHMLTVAEVKVRTGAPLFLSEADSDAPRDSRRNAFPFFFGFDRTYPDADRLFRDGEILRFGTITLRVLATPGHTAGSVTFLTDGCAFTGDTLFAAGYGRTDLPSGDYAALRRSLEKLSALPKDTVIYPGHGDTATLGAALPHLN